MDKARGLSERSEFPRVPFNASTRRGKRGTGVFFWFVFFHVEENERLEKFCGKLFYFSGRCEIKAKGERTTTMLWARPIEKYRLYSA